MNFIQTLPNNEYFVLGLIALFAILWVKHPKKVFWQTAWWGRHICGDFDKSGHDPVCFDCKVTNNDTCMRTLECRALREKMGVDINGEPIR